jgi:hypothetical protein
MVTPEQIVEFARQPENEEVFAAVLEKVLPSYTRFLWGRPSAYKRFFLRWQQAGFSLYPNHYYSPIPDLTKLTPDQLTRRTSMAGIELDAPAMIGLVESFHERFVSEYIAFRNELPNEEGRFFLGNGVFESVDAETLHCMIRHLRPKRVIEIGCGYSSLITAAACELNRAEGHLPEFSLIEPYPNDLFIRTIPGVSRILRMGVEECPLQMFEELEAGDVLFIDSTHVIRSGNDVEFEYFEIIPRLKRGVVIHIHDIFLPFRYPESWIRQECIFWNEQYLVEAMLMHNQSFKVLWAGCYMNTEHPECLAKAFPGYDPTKAMPGSIWLVRQ